ncbi:hypothetical protein V8C34DRAFT_137701 [Trichoderma compactum]
MLHPVRSSPRELAQLSLYCSLDRCIKNGSCSTLVRFFYSQWLQGHAKRGVRPSGSRHCSWWVSFHAKIRVGGGGVPGRAFNGLFASYLCVDNLNRDTRLGWFPAGALRETVMRLLDQILRGAPIGRAGGCELDRLFAPAATRDTFQPSLQPEFAFLQTVASVLVTSMSTPLYFSILPLHQSTSCRSGFSAGKLHRLSNYLVLAGEEGCSVTEQNWRPWSTPSGIE